MADEGNQLLNKLSIPREEAFRICEAIRAQYRGKWWTAAGMQCWGCSTFTKGDPEKRCVTSAPGYRGCGLVSARYDEQFRS